jgi:hypothetical protein
MSQDNSLPIHAANGTITRIESLSNVPAAARLIIVRADGTERSETFESRGRRHPGKYLKDEYTGFRVFTNSVYNQAENTLRVTVRDITDNDWRNIKVKYPDGDRERIETLDDIEVTDEAGNIIQDPDPLDYVDALERDDYNLCKFIFNPETRDFEVELGPAYVTLAFQIDDGNDEARETFSGDECNYENEIEAMYGDAYDIDIGDYEEDDHSIRVELTELTPRERRQRRQLRAEIARIERERLAREDAAREAAAREEVARAARIICNLPKLKVPRDKKKKNNGTENETNNVGNAENIITSESIANGNMMANFHGEYEQGRYYKKSSVNRIMAGRNNQKKNPYTRVPISPENITHYVAKVNNVPANNAVAGGTRRRKRKARKTRRRRN